MDDLITRKPLYILWGILALSLILRIYHIDKQSLWLDELYSIVPTAPENSLDSIIEYCKDDQPPLFFIFIHLVFKAFGYTEVVGRVACALVGVLGVAVVYFLGKEYKNQAVGLFACYIAAINYFHIYYSQEVRFYSMVFLFVTLSYLFFIRSIKGNRLIDFLFYSFFTACLLYTHYYGLFIFISQALIFPLLLFYKRDLKFLVLSVVSAITIVALFSPWIPVIIRDMGADLSWIKMPESYFVAQYFYDYFGKEVITTLLFLVFTYLFVKQLFRDSETRGFGLLHLTLVAWILASYLVPYLRSVFVSPMLNVRYTMVTLPAWLIIIAIGWGNLRTSKLKYGLSLILLISFLVNMVFFKEHYTKIQKSQFREASKIVLSKNQSHFRIYSNLPWHFNFYFRGVSDKVTDFQDANPSREEKFWLLLGQLPKAEMDAELSKIEETFVIIEKYSFYEANTMLLMPKTQRND